MKRKIEPVHIPDPSENEHKRQVYDLNKTYTKEDMKKHVEN